VFHSFGEAHWKDLSPNITVRHLRSASVADALFDLRYLLCTLQACNVLKVRIRILYFILSALCNQWRSLRTWMMKSNRDDRVMLRAAMFWTLCSLFVVVFNATYRREFMESSLYVRDKRVKFMFLLHFAWGFVWCALFFVAERITVLTYISFWSPKQCKGFSHVLLVL
jgi:hypothetical protein